MSSLIYKEAFLAAEGMMIGSFEVGIGGVSMSKCKDLHSSSYHQFIGKDLFFWEVDWVERITTNPHKVNTQIPCKFPSPRIHTDYWSLSLTYISFKRV
jgi:hypothetical protein